MVLLLGLVAGVGYCSVVNGFNFIEEFKNSAIFFANSNQVVSG
jgi:hypothetical protein